MMLRTTRPPTANHRRPTRGPLAFLLAFVTGVAVVAPLPALGGIGDTPETSLTDDEYKKLDTFEAHSLKQADEAFSDAKKRDLARAAAEYDAFLVEFPRSPAVPYALLRKGRALQLGGERFAAIKEYGEVLDYFPNRIRYASAALYHTGEAHWQNGDEEQALKAWAEMAEDEDYSKNELAATAVNALAAALWQRDQKERATGYWEQVARDFRAKNPQEAADAIDRLVPHYIRHKPDEPKLRTLYADLQTFHDKPRRIEGEVGENREYWDTLIDRINRNGRFEENDAAARESYFRYWSQQLAQASPRFQDWDDYQIALANYQRAYEDGIDNWYRRLDAQFARGYDDGDWGRITRWIQLYQGHDVKVAEYYKRYDFARMGNGQIIALMRTLYDVNQPEIAEGVFGRIRLAELKDEDRIDLARYFWDRSREAVERVLASMDDRDRAMFELLRFHADARKGDTEAGLELADEVVKLPEYANEAYWLKGEMLKEAERYADAIAAFSQFQPRDKNDPAHLWQIADCYRRMNETDRAVGQLQEIENFFESAAPAAALRIADYYGDAKRQAEQVRQLRAVIAKYGNTGQAAKAHEQLERMGFKTGGGGE